MYIELRPFLVHYDLVIPKIMLKRMASYLFCPCLPSIRSSYFQTPLSILMPCMRSGVAESLLLSPFGPRFYSCFKQFFFPPDIPSPLEKKDAGLRAIIGGMSSAISTRGRLSQPAVGREREKL